MNCQRYQVNEAEYLVYTDTINLKVYISCAIIAVELEIAVEDLPRLRTNDRPGDLLDGDLPLNSAA